MANNRGTVAVVENLVKPIVEENGCKIWDVRFEKEGPDWMLRIWIDKVGEPLDIKTVETITRLINPMLDEADPITQSYYLEVGGPGLGRKLVTSEHFQMKMGSEVTAHLYRNIDGSKDYVGVLKAYTDKVTTLQNASDEEIELNNSDIAYVKLNDDKDLF